MKRGRQGAPLGRCEALRGEGESAPRSGAAAELGRDASRPASWGPGRASFHERASGSVLGLAHRPLASQARFRPCRGQAPGISEILAATEVQTCLPASAAPALQRSGPQPGRGQVSWASRLTYQFQRHPESHAGAGPVQAVGGACGCPPRA